MGMLTDFIANIFNGKRAKIKKLTKLANDGSPDAQYELGLCYDEGDGVKENKHEAFKWFLKAANQEHGRAQNAVGLCYEYGDGVQKNLNEAIRWYHRSIENGCTKGMLSLAGVYANEGKDDKAWELIDHAASLGNEDAKNIQRQMGRKV